MSASFGSGTAVTMKTKCINLPGRRKEKGGAGPKQGSILCKLESGWGSGLGLADPRKLKPGPVLREARRGWFYLTAWSQEGGATST